MESINKKIKVYIHTPSWHISKNNTDINLRKKLFQIHERFEGIEMHMPKKIVLNFIFNIKYVFKNICGRFGIHFNKVELNRFVGNDKTEIIISQGHFPKMKKYNIPIIWEIFFLNPKLSDYNTTEVQDNKWFEKILPEYKLYAEKSAIIGVRDFYSIQLFKELIPEYSEKIRFLPFYLPDLESISELEVVEKHRSEVVRLVFVGGQANRKDLSSLISAYKIVYDSLVDKGTIDLTIISVMSDGEIHIPNDLPIKHFKGLPYGETLTILRESHVYVMTSIIESFGISYIEGMASGCCVIGRDLQPQRDMFEYGKAGILVQPNSPEKLAQEIISLLNNRNHMQNIAIQGLKRFNELYHWKKVGKYWTDVFKELV